MAWQEAGRTCSNCPKIFTPEPGGSKAFCPECVTDLKARADAAIRHVKAIDRGDHNEIPETDDEERRVRRAIANKYPPTPDQCQYKFTRKDQHAAAQRS